MFRTASACAVALALAASLSLAAPEAPLSHAQALTAIDAAAPVVRLTGVERLAEIGTMADADRLVARLRDDDERVRALAGLAMWQIWSRSGDAKVDALYKRGVEEMESSRLAEALATFSEIIRTKPAFAEGWNKRATIYFLLGKNERSLQDCDEVLKRNRNHFGALSGMAQIYLKLGNPERALEYFHRALVVNPNLSAEAQAARVLEHHLANRRRKTI